MIATGRSRGFALRASIFICCGFPPRRLSFLHCPIPDFGVVDDAHLLALVAELKQLVDGGATLYVHCYGGHGRTGTVIVNLLQTMGAAASPTEAMALLRARHASRGCRSCALLDGELEAPEQEAQAAALASQHRRGRMLQ